MKKVRIYLFLFIVTLLYGCGETGVERGAFARIDVWDAPLLPVKIKCSLNRGRQDIERPMEIYDKLLGGYEEELIPVICEEELSETEWEEDIRPYMEYDWLQDKYILKKYTENLYLRMQLMDLNMDGQREMLVFQSFGKYDFGSVYTVEGRRVVYCGRIPAECEPGKIYNLGAFNYVTLNYERTSYIAGCMECSGLFKNKFLDYWPFSYIDVYQNEEGEVKCLSGVCNGEQFEIYESTFDGKEVTCELLYAVRPTLDLENEDLHWNYLTAENRGNWDEAKTDDGGFTKLNGVMSEYMDGYKKVKIPPVTSDYTVPVLEHSENLVTEQYERVKHNWILTGGHRANIDKRKRQSETVRNNIRAGFITAMEGTVTDGESAIALGELFKEFYDSYPEEVRLSDSTPTQIVTSVEIEGGIYRNIYFLNYDDIGVNLIGYNQLNGDISGEQLYVLCITLDTPRFSTSKGIRVGMTVDELIKAYGRIDVEYEEGMWNCTYEKDGLDIEFDVEEGKISAIHLYRTDLYKQAIKETKEP